MKTSLILTTILAFAAMNTLFAQQTDNQRIPTKGFAVHEAHGHFQHIKMYLTER